MHPVVLLYSNCAKKGYRCSSTTYSTVFLSLPTVGPSMRVQLFTLLRTTRTSNSGTCAEKWVSAQVPEFDVIKTCAEYYYNACALERWRRNLLVIFSMVLESLGPSRIQPRSFKAQILINIAGLRNPLCPNHQYYYSTNNNTYSDVISFHGVLGHRYRVMGILS